MPPLHGTQVGERAAQPGDVRIAAKDVEPKVHQRRQLLPPPGGAVEACERTVGTKHPRADATQRG